MGLVRNGWLAAGLMWVAQAAAMDCRPADIADCVGLPPAGVDFLDVDVMNVPRMLTYDRAGRRALEQTLQARYRNDGDIAAGIDLGILAAQNGRDPEARFERVAAEAAHDPVLSRRLAWARGHACMAAGDATCALAHWYDAASTVDRHPDWIPLAYALGLWDAGQQDQAIAWYSTAVRSDVRLGRADTAARIGGETRVGTVARDLFPAWAARHAVQRTTLTAEADIDREGRISRLVVPDDALDARLLREVRRVVPAWRFDPVLDASGNAVTLATHMQIEVRMGADDGRGAPVEIQYAGMGPVVERSALPYPPQAVSRRQQGEVSLRVRVTPEGKAEDIEILQSSGHSLLDSGAKAAVAEWTFKPDRINGQPVPSTVTVPISYRMATRQQPSAASAPVDLLNPRTRQRSR
ncbi:energy transducer TonB [Pseudofulvimonas gallinarii]|uniref:TonB family protein n=1 Tax=Pseudofulvimonas gallinarii TaxID=634155 RepID=A0A4S3KZ55_9GAMM|nr:energy transducer TonB [Pseudofulvimonas gallinarii]TCS94503.1 TonB family protein [Pseudofulvimonas gallinarii]THD14546.1 hypothetical protein B1808_03100 [Pseudofulvimonas gallinarii]